MPDWNNDGKQDWHDDYVINEIIPDKKNNKSTGSHQSSGVGCTLPAIIIFAILWGIVNLLASLRY